MGKKRAITGSIILNSNWDTMQNKPTILTIGNITYEALNANGDVGENAGQLATGNHDHEIGDISLIFENQLI